MKRITHSTPLVLTMLFLTGCSSVSSRWSDPGACLRNKCHAQIAWHEWSRSYDELNHPHHFAKGFKAGYRDVLEGGNGCQPTLAPRCYWKSCYRSACGREKVNAWFDGFTHGAMAAQQDGVGGWNEIPISPTARLNLARANAPRQPAGWGHGPPPPIASPAPPAHSQPLMLKEAPGDWGDSKASWSDEESSEESWADEAEDDRTTRPYE